MILNVFAVYDKAVGAYLQPFFGRTKAEAVRSFAEACNDEKSPFGKHPADFHLSYLGEWDDNGGTLVPRDPVRIISALECLVDNPFTPDKQIGNGDGVKRLPM